MKKKEKIKGEVAFNPNYILYLLGFAFSLFFLPQAVKLKRITAARNREMYLFILFRPPKPLFCAGVSVPGSECLPMHPRCPGQYPECRDPDPERSIGWPRRYTQQKTHRPERRGRAVSALLQAYPKTTGNIHLSRQIL